LNPRIGAALCVLSALLSATAAPAQNPQNKQLHEIYEKQLSSQMLPLLKEVVAFQTLQGNIEARKQQQAWLHSTGEKLGLTVRDADLMTEVELPGPPGAPVLGLIVHGDVQPVSPNEWATPPFTATLKDGWVYGRGTIDDKGPLVQALLAMKALQLSGVQRTHTIRLLVGSDEESDNLDIKTYLKDHQPPHLSLVLDSLFPVVVGEKAWVEFTQTARDPYRVRGESKAQFEITNLEAGLATSIVPSLAKATLRWRPESTDGLAAAVSQLKATKLTNGITHEVSLSGRDVNITVHGHASHAGMDLASGRNALVFLANMVNGLAAPSGAADLLGFASHAGSDLHGAGLDLALKDPVWGTEDVNVATIKSDQGALKMAINLRHIPPMSLPDLRAHLEKQLADFNQKRGATLVPGGFYEDTPLSFNLNAKLVKRLMAVYERSTGKHEPYAISGGGTYAKRMPNSIAFGMWFPGKPYSAHASNEGGPIADLHRGVGVLLDALVDLSTNPPMQDPLQP
jgi:predicted dipeptidase